MPEEENEVVEEQTSPMEVVEPEPEVSETSAEPKITDVAPSQPSLEDEVELNMGGRVEKVSRAEYEYLARMGAQTLFDQSVSDRSPDPANPPPVENNPYNPQTQEDETSERFENMEGQLSSMQNQLQQAQIEAESQKIQNYVENRLYQSETFNAVSQLDGAEQLLSEVRKEIYNKSAQEKLNPEEAVNQVEAKYNSLLGGDRKNYLMGKLRATAEAVPGVGGKARSPGKPMDASDWTSGKLLDSITEKLNSSGM